MKTTVVNFNNLMNHILVTLIDDYHLYETTKNYFKLNITPTFKRTFSREFDLYLSGLIQSKVVIIRSCVVCNNWRGVDIKYSYMFDFEEDVMSNRNELNQIFSKCWVKIVESKAIIHIEVDDIDYQDMLTVIQDNTMNEIYSHIEVIRNIVFDANDLLEHSEPVDEDYLDEIKIRLYAEGLITL